jgi:hypothetical protein
VTTWACANCGAPLASRTAECEVCSGGLDTFRPPLKRPGWVWFLIVLYGYSGVSGLFAPLIIQSFPTTSPYHQGAMEIAFGLIDSMLLIAIAVALFRLRSTAIRLFIAELGLSVFSTIYNVSTDAPYRGQFFTPARLIFTIVGFAITFVIIRYLIRLEQRGVLT